MPNGAVTVVFQSEEDCFEPCFVDANEGKEVVNTSKLLCIPCLKSDQDELDFAV